ncbi:MAG: hypothetical protein IKZ99_10520 [Salinivirgaceae bacterium]|nr:hypothetical protein [Salinivirgaceae bacterium]
MKHRILDSVWFCFLVVIAAIISIAFLFSHINEQKDARIEIEGINGEGLVTDVRLGKLISGTPCYSVSYEYEVKGETYYKTVSFYDMNHYATVGMKYEIKYLEDKPQKSRIYLDKLIGTE